MTGWTFTIMSIGTILFGAVLPLGLIAAARILRATGGRPAPPPALLGAGGLALPGIFARR
jgi:hypothetical protein